MEDRTALDKIAAKYKKLRETPYMDTKGIDEMAERFARFVNCFDAESMVGFGMKLATEDDYVKKYMEENGLTAPADVTEAKDRALALVGEALSGEHRTLQQNFMRVFLSFVEIQAAMYEAGIYDLRNEDTCRLCHAMWGAIKDRDDLYLRMV